MSILLDRLHAKYPRATGREFPCSTCGAKPGDKCATKSGRVALNHTPRHVLMCEESRTREHAAYRAIVDDPDQLVGFIQTLLLWASLVECSLEENCRSSPFPVWPRRR